MSSDDLLAALTAKLNEIAKKARYDLETDDQGYGESQYLRGRIHACKDALELVKPRVVSSTAVILSNAVGREKKKP